MRVGITGSQGFIGSHLADWVDEPILFRSDLRNLESVKSFVRECDKIYHVAGKNRANDGEILSNNLAATGNLVHAIRSSGEEKEIVFISSTQAGNNSEYGITKLIEEDMIKRLPAWVIFRVPNVYGQDAKPYYNSVVATFIHQIVHNEKVTLHDPKDIRSFIYIDDLIPIITANVSLNQTHIIKGEDMSIGDIYGYLTDRLGEHPKLEKCLSYQKARVTK